MSNHHQTITIAGEEIPPNKIHHLKIPVAHLPTQTLMTLPVIVINGVESGAKLWLSAAIHGDEINGVEIIRQILQQINPEKLHGTVIGVPIVNVFGFIEQSRYLPDRRDLNRCFPGSETGSLASRLANLFMREIVSKCTHGIDLHTAAIHRTNLPQIRANLKDEETYRCAKAFGTPIIIHATSRDGSMRQAVSNRGIPILLYEAGEALRFDPDAIRIGVEGIFRVMNVLEMYPLSPSIATITPQEIYESKWVRASRGGIFLLKVKLGQLVEKKQILGIITDTFDDHTTTVKANFNGIVIGHIQNPLVHQGDAIVHLAIPENVVIQPDLS
jgi:predicted deacylase